MATDLPQTDMRAFYAFLGDRMGEDIESLTPEKSVSEFRAYQQQLQQFLHESASAFENAKNDHGRELNVDTVMKQVERRIAEERSRP